MITVEFVKSLKDDEGCTLKNGEFIRYKTGYQVATHGFETRNPEAVLGYVEHFHGNCGIWFKDGIYAVDESFRVSDKRSAILLGRACNQKTIYDWKRDTCPKCSDKMRGEK